jgi:hypothetical protein
VAKFAIAMKAVEIHFASEVAAHTTSTEIGAHSTMPCLTWNMHFMQTTNLAFVASAQMTASTACQRIGRKHTAG